MQEEELRKYAICSFCHSKIGHSGSPLFWQMKVTRHAVDLRAVQKQDGFANYMGNSVLARVMGVNPEMTKVVMEEKTLSVCETCASVATLYQALDATDINGVGITETPTPTKGAPHV